MLKRLFNPAGLILAFVLVSVFAACATATGTPQQQYITDATNATVLIDQVTLAADNAVKAGVLKGGDARTTLEAVKAARDGLNVTKAMALTDPVQARGRVGIVLATLTATQTYLAYLATQGAQP